ncbi:MAG: dihydrofolate reductase [Rhodovibrionaceae bacterium]
MEISLIVALGRNRVIGVDGELPWHLPDDLRWFKAATVGKPIVMGRKTYDSIGKPLPNRPNIVVTRNPDFAAEGVAVCPGIEEALRLAEVEAKKLGASEIMVIGGGDIFGLALRYTDRMYLTQVDIAAEGDAFFPEYDESDWREMFCERVAAEEDRPAHCFMILERR